MYFGFWPFFVLYVLKFEIKRQKVPTLNGIPGSAPAFDHQLVDAYSASMFLVSWAEIARSKTSYPLITTNYALIVAQSSTSRFLSSFA
jgi:hypothetical protein